MVLTLSRMPIKDMLSKLSKRFGKVLNHACILLRNLRETTLANTELLLYLSCLGNYIPHDTNTAVQLI